MSRLSDLLRELRQTQPRLARDLQREVSAIADRRAFGLNFERHVPEVVELPSRKVRKRDKVRVLAPRGQPRKKSDEQLWQVTNIDSSAGIATLQPLEAPATSPKEIDYDAPEKRHEETTAAVEDLIVVAEFRDPIYPGLVSTGKVQRGGEKPFHTVINAENFYALATLLFTHRGAIDCIYIDPPYNSGARDWKYNNDYVENDDLYRHSKWLAMMERRLLLARELLNPNDSVLIVTIDEKEYLRLGLLLEQTFPEARIQMVSSQINPAAVARAGAFGRSDEYIFFVKIGSSTPSRVELSREWVSAKGRTHTGKVRWDQLQRSGKKGSARRDSPGCFYPIYVDPDGPKVEKVGEPLPEGVSVADEIPGAIAVLPIRRDGSEGRWQWTPATLKSRMKEGRVRIAGTVDTGFSVSILKPGEYTKIVNGEFEVVGNGPDGSIIVADQGETDTVRAIPSTQWRISSHDSTQYGTRLLDSGFLPGRDFPYPKSLYAVEDALRFFVAENPSAVILDFFAGSGTTAHAVMRLNKQYGGRRQCISVTNNEVSADEQKVLRDKGFRPGDPDWERWGICEHITKPRIEAAITGQACDGKTINGDYKFTDEFPMANGLEENVEFFALTYEAPLRVASHREFSRIAPLLWIRAGSVGRRIEDVSTGWDVAEAYGILADLDQTEKFLEAVNRSDQTRISTLR